MNFFDGADIDQNILEQTNPVFNTAKMTLFQLADSGNKDALAICEKLGLTREGTQNSRTTTASPEQMEAAALLIETRYRTMGILAEKSGCGTCVDLPCGYTPRAVEFAGKNIPFIGMDLPAAIAEAEPAILSLLDDEKKKLVKFRGVDATNYASLEAALEGVEGSVCITTEGLVMYFTESEEKALCANIRRILSKHGGCWILADPESSLVYMAALKSVCGDRFMEIAMKAKSQVMDKSDVKIGTGKLSLRLKTAQDDMKTALMFLAEQGFKVERMIIADYMPDLVSVSKLDADKAAAYTAGMKKCAFWKMTVSESGSRMDTSDVGSKDFDASAELRDGIMFLNLKGRLDTMTAPNLLAFYEKNKEQIHGVRVNCRDLDYISSAGLRVLLIMQKGCENGVTIAEINDVVSEILEQTGFDQVLTVE